MGMPNWEQIQKEDEANPQKTRLIPLRIEIAKLEMRPEDVLLIKLPPDPYGPDQQQAFLADVNREMPDLRVLILPDVADVTVLRKVE